MKTNIQIIIIIMVYFCLLSACNNSERTGYLKEGALICEDYDTLEDYLNILQHMGTYADQESVLYSYELLAIHENYIKRGCFLTLKQRPIIIPNDKKWNAINTPRTNGMTIAKVLPYVGEDTYAFTIKEFIVYD